MVHKETPWVLLLVLVKYLVLRYRRLIFGLAERHEENVKGKTVVVLGANGGLGKTTALEMAKRGATVVLACRNQVLGERALEEIEEQTGSKDLILMKLDLGDLSSVRKFATVAKNRFPKIDILINCAGIFDSNGKLEYTKDGFEQHFGINHLGPFLLTNLLLDNLRRGAPSRIVTISSIGAAFQELDLTDLNFKKNSGFSSYGCVLGNVFSRGYSCSKFANNLFSFELGYRLKGSGVTTYSLCPGVVDTEIFRNQGYARRLLTRLLILFGGLTPEQGVETILYCALSKLSAQETGRCYQFSRLHDFGNQSNNKELAKNLWEESERLVGISKN